MCLDNAVKIAQIVAYSVGAIGIGVSLFTYWKNNKVKRGEWLRSLYEKFYESENYKEVRQKIEYNKIKEYLDLDVNGDATNFDNEEKLIDYLNFFEFIATLQQRGHIQKDEVADLFDYYFNRVKGDDFLMQYIAKEEYGFEKLKDFFNDHK